MLRVATNPAVAMVALGLVLYPFVREERAARVLRLTEGQVDRAIHDERGRSDAPETIERRQETLARALDEEALAEYAITHELHRDDDHLRRTLAEAARRTLVSQDAVPAPSDDELRALAAEAPVVLEKLVDVTARSSTDDTATRSWVGVRIGAIEAELAVAHLPLPGDEPVTVATTSTNGTPWHITLRVHPETAAEQFTRARPELVAKHRALMLRAQERSALERLRAGYDRVEAP